MYDSVVNDPAYPQGPIQPLPPSVLPPPKAEEEGEKLDLHELLAAIILGLAAIGAAVASYQSDEWGGTATQAYQQANKQTTQASTMFSTGVSIIARDAAVDTDIKRLTFEGMTSNDPAVKLRNFIMAKYMLVFQFSEQAYTALSYPKEYHSSDINKVVAMPDQVLIDGLDKQLNNPAYVQAIMTDGVLAFGTAEVTFKEGLEADDHASDFSMVVVYYTVCLFLAGIGLVIKGRPKWAFFGLGALALLISTIFLFKYDWA